jgi:hypothetical protein
VPIFLFDSQFPSVHSPAERFSTTHFLRLSSHLPPRSASVVSSCAGVDLNPFSTREPMRAGITFWSCRSRTRRLHAARNFFLPSGLGLRSFLISRPRSKPVDLSTPNSFVRLCFLHLCSAPAGLVLAGVTVRFIPCGPARSSPECIRPNPKL